MLNIKFWRSVASNAESKCYAETCEALEFNRPIHSEYCDRMSKIYHFACRRVMQAQNKGLYYFIGDVVLI